MCRDIKRQSLILYPYFYLIAVGFYLAVRIGGGKYFNITNKKITIETLFPKILEWSISLGIAIAIMTYFIRRDKRKDRERIEERQRREE